MTAPDYPRCEACGQAPRVIRHVGGTETVEHLTGLPCEAYFAAYPPDRARTLWRQWSQE